MRAARDRAGVAVAVAVAVEAEEDPVGATMSTTTMITGSDMTMATILDTTGRGVQGGPGPGPGPGGEGRGRAVRRGRWRRSLAHRDAPRGRRGGFGESMEVEIWVCFFSTDSRFGGLEALAGGQTRPWRGRFNGMLLVLSLIF